MNGRGLTCLILLAIYKGALPIWKVNGSVFKSPEQELVTIVDVCEHGSSIIAFQSSTFRHDSLAREVAHS